MTSVRILAWHPGLQKVKLTKVLQKYIGLSLATAKTITDRILAEEKVVIEIESYELAQSLATQLTGLGLSLELFEGKISNN